MMHEYTQSVEEYKGFTLEIRMCRNHDQGQYHRSCILYKDGKSIARSKTKKEMKDLIDHGCFK